MKGSIKCFVMAVIILWTGLSCNPAFGQADSTKHVRYIDTIQLLGKGNYVDYINLSPDGRILYAGYASENAIAVIDTQSKKVISFVRGLNNVRSIALVPELNLGFTSNRGDGTIGVIDLKTNHLLKRLSNGRGPDAIIYDNAAHLVYVSNHEGRSATLIDPDAKEIIGTIKLGGLAEFTQADPKTGIVYQNLEDLDEIAVIDPKKRAVVAHFKTAPGKGPTGLAFDPVNRRLFCGCGNDKLIVLDADNGKVIAVLPIGSGVDFVGYDPKLHRIYTANSDSVTMTIIHQDSKDHYTVVENVRTHKGAHALAIDPERHRIYLVFGRKIAIYEAINE